MNFKNSLVIGLSLLFSITLFSKNIYLKYDPACMDRYEYRLNGNMAGNGLISYYLKGNDSERIMLEIGVESIRQVKNLPKGTKTCGKVRVNALFAKSVNSGKDKVYIVRRVGKYYLVSPVHLATYMKETSNSFSMTGNEFDFDYSVLEVNAMEHNLSARDMPTKVYFMGREEQECLTNYVLKKIPEETCKPYTDLSFIPGIGVIEEKIGVSQAEAEQNVMRLVKINNVPLAEYLDRTCNKTLAEVAVKYKPQPEEMAEESVVFEPATTITKPAVPKKPKKTKKPKKSPKKPVSYEVLFPAETKPIAPEYTPASNELVYEYNKPQKPVETFRPKAVQCKKLSYPGVHIIQTNQTLYSISRKYGVTVKQLRSWNKMGNKDLIKPCESLYVLPPASVTANRVQPNTTNSSQFTDKGTNKSAEVLYKNTGTPSSYNENSGDAEILYRNTETPSYNNTPTNYDNNTVKPVDVYNKVAKRSEVLFPKTNAKAASTPKKQQKAAPCSKISYDGVHIIQVGETLYSIARKNDVTVDQLAKWNNLPKDAKIKSCKSLYIKAPKRAVANNSAAARRLETLSAKSGNTAKKILKEPCQQVSYNGVHIIQTGETLYSIARKNGVTVDQIERWNKLPKGAKLRPCGGLYVRTPESVIAANNANPNPNNTIHTIPNSEISTGYTNAAENTNVTPSTTNPSATNGGWNNSQEYHTVQKGETLAALAKRYGFTIARFRDLNGLGNSNIIQIGQVLKTGSCLCPADGNTQIDNTNGGNAGSITSVNTIPPVVAPKGGNVSNTTTERQGQYMPTPAPYDYETESIIIQANHANSNRTVSRRNGRIVHTVQENETLATIANKYNIAIEVLRKLNDMEKGEVVIPNLKIYLE